MEILYEDRRVIVAVKPSGVLSVDEPGGMPDLIRDYLGDEKACVRTVHRLDRVVGGLMVFARSREASRILSQQVRERTFHKVYLAIVHGIPENKEATCRDLLLRDKESRMTSVTNQVGPGVQEAILRYKLLETVDRMSLLRIELETGRTHQIRVQLSSRGMPIVGDKRYGILDDAETIALWSAGISFIHPQTGERMSFSTLPPSAYPWNQGFGIDQTHLL